MRRLALVLCCLFSPAAATADQQPTPEQIRAMIEKNGPGPEHRTLAALEGRWAAEITYNMGGPPMKATGTAVNRMILGGRFLSSETVSSNPAGAALGGNTIEALSIYGFDRRTSEYTMLGLDTMGTYWVSAAGVMKPAQTIVMAGESLDDHGGAREVRKYDMVLRVIDADTYVTEIIFKFPNRPDLKIVDITHRRIK